MSAVLDAAHQLVQAYPGGAESLAPRMGKNATTLRHEVNRTGSAKLGLADAVSMSVLTQDLRVLNAFAAECGCLVLPMPTLIGGDSGAMLRVAVLAKEFGEVVGSVTEAAADGRVSANELHRVQEEWSQLVAAGQQLMSHMQAQYEAGRPPEVKP
ncbi:phage regulatory CII family protein [Hydrogenophaga sp. R2]|uniref:phage regulatory CII family protein n=1 Tax=Hydrogenophaga sp. R2 TaxID=3132827 RepID=UPI003CE8AD14